MTNRPSLAMETGDRLAGSFEVEPGRRVFGELSLDDERSLLYLRDDAPFTTHALPGRHLNGQAHDLSSLSLFDCVTLAGPGTGMLDEQRYTFCEVFPHHVVRGYRQLGPDEKAIRSLVFSIDDGHALFYDFDSLGTVLDPGPLIGTVANANRDVSGRVVRTGKNPRIHYYAGRGGLLARATATGRVKVSNLVEETWGSPRRMALESRIGFEIGWKKPVALVEALGAVNQLIRFLELVAGRAQHRRNLLLRVDRKRNASPTMLSVYSPLANRWPRGASERGPGPSDVLIDGIRNAREFGDILCRWLALDAARRDARERFAHAFRKSNQFGEDRLIGASNMFDLLPPDAVPGDVDLPSDLSAATSKARGLFSALPDSPERASMLSAIGRIGKASLVRKVLHRARILTQVLPRLEPDMELVVREAIRCRNHYVHGSDASYDYRADGDALSFFTSTLEFIFGASELVECGWSIDRSAGGSHPFDNLLRSWSPRVANLKARLSQSR